MGCVCGDVCGDAFGDVPGDFRGVNGHVVGDGGGMLVGCWWVRE